MVQMWRILNVDKREASQHGWGALGGWFFYPHEQLISHLSIPRLPKAVDEWLSTGPVHAPRGPISNLPVEAIELIFDELRELHEVVFLAITCKSLLAIGRRHVLRATREHYAPWAGCRLITLGDDTRTLDDLPPALLTPDERAEIEETELGERGEEETADVDPDVHARNLSNFANERYARVFHTEWRMTRANRAFRLAQPLPREAGHGEHATTPGTSDFAMFSALYGDGRRAASLRSSPGGDGDGDGPQVLCNLSKGEYVCADGLGTPSYANLAHALLARICWTSAPESELGIRAEDGDREVLAAGPWAGDRFCITAMGRICELDVKWVLERGGEQKESGRGWKDVTSEVDELLARVWAKNSGPFKAYCKK